MSAASDSDKKIIVFGVGGQVSRALLNELGARAIGIGFPEVDFSRLETVEAVLEKLNPNNVEAVINAIAYTAVDKAETEAETARKINAIAPGRIASWCAERSIPFIHYSTDYVYSGEGVVPWKESDPTGPQNAYGRTKLEGDEAVARAGGKWLVFRTSWVYDAVGKNFPRTMLKFGRDRAEMKVVGDQIGAPTSAESISRITLQALEKARVMPTFPSGVYHLCSRETTSWHGFAEEIFTQARARGFKVAVRNVTAIPSSEFPTPAKRPTNSRLNLEKLERVFGIRPPSWKESLTQVMEQIDETSIA